VGSQVWCRGEKHLFVSVVGMEDKEALFAFVWEVTLKAAQATSTSL